MNSFLIDWNIQSQGRSRISKKGVQMCKGVGGGFANFISFFLNIP